MARGRILSTNVARDPELNGLSTEALLLYLMAIPHLDRDGLLDGDPTLLWATVAPRRVELLDKAAALIEEWVKGGLVIRYAWKDGAALFFKGFPRHNANMAYRREPPSRFPCPPGFVRTHVGLAPQDAATAARWLETVNPKSEYFRVLAELAGVHADNMQSAGSLHAEYMQSAGSVQEGCNDARTGVHADDMQSAGTLQRRSNGRTCNVHDEDQDQVEDRVEVEEKSDGDGDHSLTHLVTGMGGSGEGGAAAGAGGVPTNGGVSAGELVYAFTVEQLRTAAYQLGSVLGLHTEWTNFAGFLGKRESGSLAVLLEWIEFYSSMPAGALEKIENLPGLVRSHLNKGERAPLTTAQKRHLGASVLEALAAAESE